MGRKPIITEQCHDSLGRRLQLARLLSMGCGLDVGVMGKRFQAEFFKRMDAFFNIRATLESIATKAGIEFKSDRYFGLWPTQELIEDCENEIILLAREIEERRRLEAEQEAES